MPADPVPTANPPAPVVVTAPTKSTVAPGVAPPVKIAAEPNVSVAVLERVRTSFAELAESVAVSPPAKFRPVDPVIVTLSLPAVVDRQTGERGKGVVVKARAADFECCWPTWPSGLPSRSSRWRG